MAHPDDSHLPPHVPQDTQDPGDWQVTGNPNTRSLYLLIAIVISMFVLTFFCWPSKIKEPSTKQTSLPVSTVAAFKEIADKVAEFDSAIVVEERKLQDLKRYGDPADQKVVRQWYAHLAILAQLKGGRYELVRIYDLAVSKVPLDISVYEELRDHGLPVAFH